LAAFGGVVARTRSGEPRRPQAARRSDDARPR
jgi:hypothetical protein